MSIIYHAYSLDLERHLGDFNASDHEGDRCGDKYKQWCLSFNEESIRFVSWPDGEWFKSIKDQIFMDPVKVEDIPKDLQMRLLIGAMP